MDRFVSRKVSNEKQQNTDKRKVIRHGQIEHPEKMLLALTVLTYDSNFQMADESFLPALSLVGNVLTGQIVSHGKHSADALSDMMSENERTTEERYALKSELAAAAHHLPENEISFDSSVLPAGERISAPSLSFGLPPADLSRIVPVEE